MVEHHLAKVGVAGSNPVVRSNNPQVRGTSGVVPPWLRNPRLPHRAAHERVVDLLVGSRPNDGFVQCRSCECGWPGSVQGRGELMDDAGLLRLGLVAAGF